MRSWPGRARRRRRHTRYEGVLSVVGDFQVGGMPDHVRMDRHVQHGPVADAREQLTGGDGWKRNGGFDTIAPYRAA